MTTALERGEGSASCPGRSLPLERPGTHCTGGWVGPRADLERCGKSTPPPPPTGFDPPVVIVGLKLRQFTVNNNFISLWSVLEGVFKIHNTSCMKACICWPHRQLRWAAFWCLSRPMNWGQDFLLTGNFLSHNNASTAPDVSTMSFLVWLHAFLFTRVRVLCCLFTKNLEFNLPTSASVYFTNQ
jgi:hypothetical protein